MDAACGRSRKPIPSTREPLVDTALEASIEPGKGHEPGWALRLSSRRWFQVLPVVTALTISLFALAEIWDTLYDFELGRAHGLLSMGLVKLVSSRGGKTPSRRKKTP